MSTWLVEKDVLAKMRRVEEANIIPSAEQLSAFEARAGRNEDGVPFIMSVAGGVAQINIRGLLTQSPDWLAEWFGGGNTTYSDIIAALALAESDSSVEEVVLSVDSGGGQISGLFDAIAAVQGCSKPITANVQNMAASAAYGLIAPVRKITASNRATQIGSIGIAASFAFDKDVEEVTITSTEAPDKRPDVRTEEGQSVIRDHLDAIHELFVEAIADGRGKSIADVNKDFGRGAVLLADDAMNRGMIDAIAGMSPSLSIVGASGKNTAAVVGETKEKGVMTLMELQAQHPDIYQAAVSAGVSQERGRVEAFAIAGEMSGDMETAMTAIKDGSEMTTALQTKFLMTAANKTSITARADDDKGAGAADDALVPDAKTESDEVVASVFHKLGLKMGDK